MNTTQITTMLGGSQHRIEQIGTAFEVGKKSKVKPTISTELKNAGFPPETCNTVGEMFETTLRETTLLDNGISDNAHRVEFNRTSAEALRILKASDRETFQLKSPQIAELFTKAGDYLAGVTETINPMITGKPLTKKVVTKAPQITSEQKAKAAARVRVTEEKAAKPDIAPEHEISKTRGGA